VENNDCDSNSDGILLEESKNNNVTSNRCSINGNAGIKLQQSSSNLIVDNLCTYNDGSGVYLTNSNNNNVCNNTFYSNSEGSFYLSDSDYNYMFNNTCNSSASGFQLRGSSFNSLVRNTCKNMEGNGIRLTSNSANNSLIENQLLSNVYGAYITNSNNNSLLSNSFINNSYTGIHLEFSSNNLIDNNDLSNNGDFGLNLYSSSNNTIINNIINDHDLAGIETYLSNYSYIENNYCSYNGQSGIKLDASFYNEAYNNTLTGHIIAGIHLSANFSIILDNVLVNNSRGIRIGGSYNNTIAFNLIKENWYYGIDIYTESENNTLHHNIFLNNNSPAIDAGANNTWYDKTTNEGNWWSTYSGTGNFTIHGSADSVDLYPFAIVLLLEHYFTANIEYGTPDNAIDWTITSAFEVSELKPLNYIIYNNGTEMDSGVLTDTYDVIYIAGGAEIGVHNYTIVVTDYLNNKAIDTAFVIVSDSTDPIISSPADISYFDGVFSTTIEWTATDLDAGTYMVYMNDTVFTSTTTWTSGEVIELVTYYLPSGIYNFTIVVSDASGNFGTDMVTITVIANLAPVISSPADITYVVGSTGNIISWTATDIDADSYYIRRNGTQIQLSQEWISGTAITFNVDGLEEGVY
jgi:parallel beta-helix repeat protein